MDMTKFAETVTARVRQELNEEFFKKTADLIGLVGLEVPVALDLAKGHVDAENIRDAKNIRFEASDIYDALQEAYVKENLESRINLVVNAAVQSTPSAAPAEIPPVWMILKEGDLVMPGDEFFDCVKKSWLTASTVYRTSGVAPHRRNIAGLRSPSFQWARLLNPGEVASEFDLAYSCVSGKWARPAAEHKVTSECIVVRNGN